MSQRMEKAYCSAAFCGSFAVQISAVSGVGRVQASSLKSCSPFKISTVESTNAGKCRLNMIFTQTAGVEGAKAVLLEKVKATKLGRVAVKNKVVKNDVEEAIKRTESLNPSKDPLNDPRLSGKWRLVYTDSETVLGTKRPVIFQPRDDIFQTIDAENRTVVNSETMNLFGFIPVPNLVRAIFTTSAPIRVNVQFKQFVFGNILKVNAPSTAKGWLDITFLDDTMRISRGNQKSVFIMVKDE
mmetsp:Transcript_3361/g.5891  ORF Transcript_3361/g.5891 Transcript_3361/m.5891 type:complete len:241 (-) Transcript_3361:664-1386(-)